MKVNNELIRTLEQLSCLSFSELETQEIKSDLSKMIAFIEKLNELEVSKVMEILNMATDEIKLRDDNVSGAIPVEKALVNAPQTKGHFFVVPKVIKK